MKRELKSKENNDKRQKSSSKSATSRGLIKREPKLTEKEKEENRQILRNMTRKLNFVKNPRFRTNRKYLLYENDEFKDVVHKDNPFAVDPPIVMFRDFQLGMIYSITLSLINKTQLLKNFKYIPPSTENFTIKKVKYPNKESSLIAPGMRAIIEVLFKPENLDPHSDYLTIITETYAFKIPLKAIRESAALTIENPMICNRCLVGEETSMVFRCRNNGGDAHFKFEVADKQETSNKRKDSNLDSYQVENENLEVGPFVIFPQEFYLIKNMPVEIFVKFNPTKQGIFEQKLNIVCDSKIYFPQTIIGEGIVTDLYLTEYDGLPLEKMDDLNINNNSSNSALEHINFDPTFPLSSSQKKLKIKNNSLVLVNYHWSIYDYYPENKIKLTQEEHFFSITPNKGIIEANGEQEFTIVFTPKSAKIYENKVDFIIEDIPFQSIKRLNHNYIREKNLNSSVNDSLLEIDKYFDPFLLGFNSPLPYYPMFTFNLKGVGKLNELSIKKDIINLGDIYLGKTVTEKFSVINKLSGCVLFKLKKIYQFTSKKSSVHNYFRSFINNKSSILPFEPYYKRNTIQLKDEIEGDEAQEKVMLKHNMMEHILSLADDYLKVESDYNTCDDLYITSRAGFYMKKIDFSTLKKAKKKKKKHYLPPRAKVQPKQELLEKHEKVESNEEVAKQLNESNENKIQSTNLVKSKTLDGMNKLEGIRSLDVKNSNLTNNNISTKKHTTKAFAINTERSTNQTMMTHSRLNTNTSRMSTRDQLSYSSTKLSNLYVDPNKHVMENMIYLADFDNKEGVEFTVHLNPSTLGKFKSTIIFSAQDCQPINVEIHANVMGPQVEINTPAIIFPLSPVSTLLKEKFLIKNTSCIDAVVLVKEYRYKGVDFENYHYYEESNKGAITSNAYRREIKNMRDFMNQNYWKIDPLKVDSYTLKFSEIFFKLPAGSSKEILVEFYTPYPIKFEDLIQVDVMNVDPKFIRVKANCQLADCYLEETLIAPEEAFISTPIKYKSNSFKMINPSNLPVSFNWETIENEDKVIKFEPKIGTILPNSVCEIKYNIIYHTSK